MKKLPISSNPYIRAYTHHAYTNAIIQKTNTDILAKIRFPEENYNNITIQSQEVDIIRNDYEYLIKSIPYETNNHCSFYRKIELNDSFIIEIIYQQYVHQWGNIQLFITNDSNTLDNNKYIYSYGNFCGDGLFIKNYDNFCDINKPGSVDNIKYPLFLKLSLFDKNTLFYYSFDMESWILCYETDMPINMSLDDLYIGVKVELSDENMYYNWVYSNYIQVMLNNGWVDNPDNISLDYYVAPQKNYNYYTVHNLLDFKYENPKLILNYVSDIIDYIVYQINYKYYVEILLNEKYIPNRNAYNKYDYNHTNLIYGYDEDKKILYIMGFNKLGKPELSEISYDIFNVAYNTSYTYANIYMLKYVPDFSMYKLNTHEIISSIDEYIHGCNTSIRFGNLFMPLNNTFGLQVYDELMKNDRNIDIFIHDVRISYLLFEHKKIMRDRISYLAKRGLINLDHSTDILCLMENIYSKSELITNLVIKYSINHDENIKNRITILMNDVKEMEKICYTNLLNLLKSDLGIQ